ncbi:transcriptional regulator, partial [Salinivibrio sp. VYel6]|uniref:phage repressor protein CI n=1 Tax=Salinivibrio sp. VYel6 TaxID=2490493 RepID=UPI00128D38AB
MSKLQPQIKPFDYKCGRELIDKIKEITHVSTDLQLADVIGVPKSTIGTWKDRGLTPYEIVIRLHLATGVSLRALLLDEGELFSETSHAFEEIEGKRLINGRLENSQKVVLDSITLNDFGVKSSDVVLINVNDEKLLINMKENMASAGRYLVDIDGTLSINQIQRLPGKKLAINFNGSSFTVT